ncbi:hypothetical protein FRC10_010023 [Ceratobasidium sp. 414]|nr:hypothetical protein FRC10_010023 [Ceratobasidium sp. 414]
MSGTPLQTLPDEPPDEPAIHSDRWLLVPRSSRQPGGAIRLTKRSYPPGPSAVEERGCHGAPSRILSEYADEPRNRENTYVFVEDGNVNGTFFALAISLYLYRNTLVKAPLAHAHHAPPLHSSNPNVSNQRTLLQTQPRLLDEPRGEAASYSDCWGLLEPRSNRQPSGVIRLTKRSLPPGAPSVMEHTLNVSLYSFGLVSSPESEARRLAAEICLAMEYSHSLEIVHRDLKPEVSICSMVPWWSTNGLAKNVLLTDTVPRHAKVTNFWLANAVDVDGAPLKTPHLVPEAVSLTKGRGSHIVGTPVLLPVIFLASLRARPVGMPNVKLEASTNQQQKSMKDVGQTDTRTQFDSLTSGRALNCDKGCIRTNIDQSWTLRRHEAVS